MIYGKDQQIFSMAIQTPNIVMPGLKTVFVYLTHSVAFIWI